ncbi:MAG: integrase arm-type DNA-binding domain-containing protein, partial [Rhodospirillales bacterium]|nr:integrase arm-type DNA-binding domain-containing protein [Rhodospirillales bacterium]
MPERQYRTLTKRIVDRLAVNGKDGLFWDSELRGFGIRVYPTGRKVYVVQTRANGKSKRFTVGRHGDIAPDQARKDAANIIARLKAGLPPVEQEPQPEPTVADLAERYEREYVAMHCKPNTIKHYGLMLKKHIVPGLGALRVSEVEKKHILKFQFGLSDMATGADRTG